MIIVKKKKKDIERRGRLSCLAYSIGYYSGTREDGRNLSKRNIYDPVGGAVKVRTDHRTIFPL